MRTSFPEAWMRAPAVDCPRWCALKSVTIFCSAPVCTYKHINILRTKFPSKHAEKPHLHTVSYTTYLHKLLCAFLKDHLTFAHIY